jgi:hypothetical protein
MCARAQLLAAFSCTLNATEPNATAVVPVTTVWKVVPAITLSMAATATTL